MASDRARVSYDPSRQWRGVVAQQGRVTLDQALQTATAIGDDRLQKEMQGYVVPDSFTHGSSAMRQQWLTAGLKSGDIKSCNTFSN